MGVEHAVEAALGGHELTLVGQGGNDLSRRQRGVLRLVANRQDLLPLLLAQAMGHMAHAPLAAVPTAPITRKLTLPALQGAQADGHAFGHTHRRSTGGYGSIEDLQCPPAISRGGQLCQAHLSVRPSSASPQRACIFFVTSSSAAASARAFSFLRSSFWSRYSFGEACG